LRQEKKKMATDGKKSSLDTVANIAIILVCAIAAVVLIRNQFFPPGPPPQPGAAKKGDTIAQIKQALPAGTERAMVVALSPSCHFCNESMPFYKKLIDERNSKGSAVKVIAAVPTDQAIVEENQKFAEAGVKPDQVVKMDFSAIKVPGTPTVLYVDNNGKVLDVWVGKQDAGGERKILKVL
jgi:thioredoxin-related protein